VGALDVARNMYKEGGLSKFYVSLDAYLFGALQPAIQFSFYDQIRPIMMKNRKGDLSAFEAFCLGTVASSLAVTVTYPMDLCRTLSQTGTGKQQNIFETLSGILKSEGFLGLFNGLSAQLFQSVLSAAIMLMVKEKIKKVTTKLLLIIFTALGIHRRRSLK